MEDQDPGGRDAGVLPYQDTNSQQRDVVGCGEHEGRVPSQNASVHIRGTVLCLRVDQRFPTRQEGHVGLRDFVHLIKQVHR